MSKRIFTTCRQAGITLGNAMSVLALLAHARLTLRLRAQGLITDAEWQEKIRQPSHFGGPINLRPYLDAEWYKSGGATRGLSAISMYHITLPSIPVAGLNEYATFDQLLSKKQFSFMCKLARKQSDKFLNHPLLVEFAELTRNSFASRSKSVAMRWRAASAGHPALPPEVTRPYILCNGCSTLGNVSLCLLLSFPPLSILRHSCHLSFLLHFHCKLKNHHDFRSKRFTPICDVGHANYT